MTENFNPLVSVVIPTYNHAAFLHKALQSVVEQTYKNLEILVVNNFSTDDTEAIVSSFSDKNISLFNFRNNGIIAAARNHGIQHATGEFIAFLDSDDVWYPTKIEECIHALKSGADIACHGEFWVMPNGHRREVMYGPEKNATYRKLLQRGNCISTSTVVVRKSILQEIDGALIHGPSGTLVPVGEENKPRTFVVCRKRFDQGVVQRSLELGAKLWLNSMPTNASVDDNGVKLTVNNDGNIVDLKCKLLLGCDGAHSWTRRFFKMGKSFRYCRSNALCLEYPRLDQHELYPIWRNLT